MPTFPMHLLNQPLPQIQKKCCPFSQLCKPPSLMLESKFPSAFVLKWIVPLGVFRWMVGQYIMRWLPSMNTLSRLTMSVQEMFHMSKIQNLWYHWYLLVVVCSSWVEKNCVIISTACTIFTLVKTSPSCYWSLCEDQADKYLPAFKRVL